MHEEKEIMIMHDHDITDQNILVLNLAPYRITHTLINDLKLIHSMSIHKMKTVPNIEYMQLCKKKSLFG